MCQVYEGWQQKKDSSKFSARWKRLWQSDMSESAATDGHECVLIHKG